MSILTKPYEISVWVDEWNGGKFVEKQLGIIGANNMIAQGRALDPKLTRNINGTKSLTFQMYKQYIDNITGEKVNNVFADWLINERKVKLKYGTYIDENGDTKDCWYDFLVKNITENSANYLCTYSLEDAFVQELSKNGFGVVLSQEQMNNIGTVEKLATEVLKETDWKVGSENFVQTIEEALVYVSLPRNLECQKITNEGDVKEGVKDETVTINDSGHGSALAFYSSCKNKPHRFQFIYLKSGYSRDTVLVDNRGVIKLSECQYFIDIENPEEEYKENNNGYFLPDGWDLFTPTGTMGNKDSTLSSWYRGRRYGYTQATEYVPLLEKYCDVYYKTEGEKEIKYYDYLNNTYTSPATNQSVIVNDGFDGTSGWVGTYFGEGADLKSTVGAKVESVYGRFDDEKFISVIDDLKNPPTPKEGEKITYESYLKVEFPEEQNGNKPVLINNGFYENRLIINNVKMNEEWCLKYEFLDEKGKNSSEQYNFALQETNYDIDMGNYSQGTVWTNPGEIGGEKLLVFKQPEVSDKEFKEKKIRLVISSSNAHTFYIKKLSLYRRILSDDGQTPIEPGEISTEGVIETSHRLFAADQLKTKKSAEDIEYITVDKIDYKVYQPDYNPGAKKIRAVSVKESNYFNILQSIAETFECWLELKVTRDEDGAIDEKFVFFRNYIGKDNYANFKYGVNLKDIQRTEESKNIVTKLIVKQNNNQHAENEFCTIARAPSNPLGENYIYDFSYYWSKELMDRDEYCDLLYHPTHPKTGVQEKGPDLGHAISECNLQNYVNRVKNINLKLEDINSKIGGLQLDLIDYNARLSIQENLRDAAASGREETVEEFYQLTGYLPTEVNKADDLDLTAESITQLLVKYTKFLNEYETAVRLIGDENGGLFKDIKDLEKRFADKKTERDNLLDYKTLLNQLFFTRYAPFIQEGTWLDEEYFEDEKYYADALSVMRESCSPQAAYTINVVALGAQPGYELFDFEIGDKTYVEDAEFFGEGVETEVVVAEMTECLDCPDKNSIKTQTFKNQFQDLFQKITATVQQAEYNTGSYERAVSFVSADGIARGKFIADSLSTFGQKLSVAGQTSVVQDINGITLTDSATKDQLRLIGGAIMMSVEDKETGVRSWRTGLTPDGITASLITTGTLNAGEIQIMNVNDPLFRWDANGLTALNSIVNDKVLKADPAKFVRFDKYGLYGMVGKNGLSYVPENLDEVVKESTFALTWQGLKVGGDNAVLNIGNGARIDESDDTLLNIKDKNGNTTFAIKNDGSLSWGASSTPTRALYSTGKSTEKPTFSWDKYPESAGEGDPTGWHRVISANDRFASYSYDGGNTWTLPIKIAATDGTPGKSIVKIVEYYARSKDPEEVPDNVATNKTEAWGVTLNNPTKAWPYLWKYEVSYYDEPMSDKAGETNPVRIAQYVENGANGADGRGISSIVNYYFTTNNDSLEGITVEWDETPEATTSDKKYLWNYELITYTDGTSYQSAPAIIGTHGAKGEIGTGIEEIKEYYLLSKEQTGITWDSEGWDDKLTSPTKDSPYLWNYETSYYTDGREKNTTPCIVASYTEDGRGIEKIQNYYLINSGDTPKKPTGASEPAGANPSANVWYTTAPKTSLLNRYLWNCEIITYTKQDANGNTIEITEPSAIGVHGDSAYSLSIVEGGFASVPANSDGTIDYFPNITLSFEAFYGTEKQSLNEESNTGLSIKATKSGLTGDWATRDGIDYYIVTGFEDGKDQGTVTFALTKTNTAVAYATFEAVKQKSGANGVYVNVVPSSNTLKLNEYSDITFTFQRRVGSGEPFPFPVMDIWGTQRVDEGGPENKKWRIESNGEFTVYQNAIQNLKPQKSLTYAFYEDEAHTILIDKINITILKDGEDGEDGETVYMVYHNKNTTVPNAPGQIDYNKIAESSIDSGWYTKLTDESVYMCQKVSTSKNQASTPWGAVTRISGVLTTVDDILGALEGETDQGIINYEGKIGINATAIKTGAITVGGLPTFDKDGNLEALNNNKFYANVENSKVYLAGWQIGENKIFKGDLYLSSSDDDQYASLLSDRDSPVRIQVGEETDAAAFLLLADGSLYSTAARLTGHVDAVSGTIGGFEITEGTEGKPSRLVWHYKKKPSAYEDYFNGNSFKAIQLTAGITDENEGPISYNSFNLTPGRLTIDDIVGANSVKATKIEPNCITLLGNGDSYSSINLETTGVGAGIGSIYGFYFDQELEGAPQGLAMVIYGAQAGVVFPSKTYIYDEEYGYFQLQKSFGVTQDWVIDQINTKVAGAVQYLGTVSAAANLGKDSSGNTITVGKGDFYRASASFTLGSETVHVGDMVIAIVNNPGTTATNWDVGHLEIDANTWTANTATTAGYVAAPGTGNGGKIWKTASDGTPGWREETTYKTVVSSSKTETTNSAAEDQMVTLNLVKNNSVVSNHWIVGGGGTTVTSNADGIITISSTVSPWRPLSSSQDGYVSKDWYTSLKNLVESFTVEDDELSNLQASFGAKYFWAENAGTTTNANFFHDRIIHNFDSNSYTYYFPIFEAINTDSKAEFVITNSITEYIIDCNE